MPPRVLIVDDSAVVRVALARKLRAAGLDVIEHDSCASALEDGRAVVCALLDYDLGDGFGVAIATRLRASSPTLPIAFFTSTLDDAVAGQASTFGPVFSKPDDLERAVAWVLDRVSAA